MPREYIIVATRPGPDGPPRLRFSGVEIRHILVSIAVLIIAFTFSFSNALYDIMAGVFVPGVFLVIMGIVSVAVLTEFLLHELAHKFTAQKYGCWSEYRYTEFGLFLTLVTGFFGYVFAAPGVVWHSGYITQEQEGKISAAGPAANLGLAAAFFAMWYFLPVAGLLALLLWFVAWINVWVGAFNLIPFPPLDGSKIWKWSVPGYAGMWAAFVLLGIGLNWDQFLKLLGL